MLRTRLCELLEIEVPVLGAPMGPEIAGLDLAAAVSNAGGLGMISFGGYPPPALRERIRKLRTMTSKPFGVNVLLEGPHLPLPESAFVDACIAERVPVLSFFWGDPTPYVEKAHNAGVKVCDQVGSVRVAKRAAAAGVDFIIAQGVEAGGQHRRYSKYDGAHTAGGGNCRPDPGGYGRRGRGRKGTCGGISTGSGGSRARDAPDRVNRKQCPPGLQGEGSGGDRRRYCAHNALRQWLAKRLSPHLAHTFCRALVA